MKNNRLAHKKYGIATNDVVRDPNLSLRDKGLYAYLCSYTSMIDDASTVSVNKAATECNVDPSTIRRIMEKLKKHGIIIREKRKQGESYKTILLK
jgi:predicted transcriptional regulator